MSSSLSTEHTDNSSNIYLLVMILFSLPILQLGCVGWANTSRTDFVISQRVLHLRPTISLKGGCRLSALNLSLPLRSEAIMGWGKSHILITWQNYVISMCSHCHCSHLCVCVVESPNFYVLLTSLQKRPIALSILILACFPHVFRRDSTLSKFFSVWRQNSVFFDFCLFLKLPFEEISHHPFDFSSGR